MLLDKGQFAFQVMLKQSTNSGVYDIRKKIEMILNGCVISPADCQLGLFPSLCVRRLSVYLSICPSVRLLDFFKPIFSYSFDWIAFKICRGIRCVISHLVCAFLDDRTIIEFLTNF